MNSSVDVAKSHCFGVFFNQRLNPEIASSCDQSIYRAVCVRVVGIDIDLYLWISMDVGCHVR